jgi:hypothetical protein
MAYESELTQVSLWPSLLDIQVNEKLLVNVISTVSFSLASWSRPLANTSIDEIQNGSQPGWICSKLILPVDRKANLSTSFCNRLKLESDAVTAKNDELLWPGWLVFDFFTAEVLVLMNDNDYLKVNPPGSEDNRTGYSFDVIKEWRDVVEFKLQGWGDKKAYIEKYSSYKALCCHYQYKKVGLFLCSKASLPAGKGSSTSHT